MQNNTTATIIQQTERPLPTHNDRFEEWKRLCQAILREENVDNLDHDNINMDIDMDPVIDLLPPSQQLKTKTEWNHKSHHRHRHRHGWEDTAWNLQLSIDQMAQLLHRELAKHAQGGDDNDEQQLMTDDDVNASVLETSVASFAARTANQIERLRLSQQSTTTNDDDHASHHRSGIVACLLLSLRMDVAKRLGEMQSARRALQEARQIAQQPQQQQQHEELQLYNEEEEEQIDEMVVQSGNKEVNAIANADDDDRCIHSDTRPKLNMRPQKQENNNRSSNLQHPHYDVNDYKVQMTQEQELLQQEPTSDVMDIQAVEARMMEITSLLTQFSTLVADQQEEVIALHENTAIAQDNMTRGQEQLEDAKERGKKSSHFMAKFVVVSALALLFLNWLLP
uniref:t-SNARE coiled-coil homology domain-containing protein n=1 Tax=Leptocylindrus danicus TaxID=163516 RepID=A0A7S2L8T8_9STRA|mmetsp:Transcript_32797/g.47478  ORF Transcript_32797/g.47478 Transcript_32797/m.47478 type:complete len:395 (+) Transcript_32797:59-1243(+)